ncbi:MAG: TonB-dependent receptor [Acidobacteriota bacterium]|nr:TonB-dependent receptor [Acidobacteriota bacterium]
MLLALAAASSTAVFAQAPTPPPQAPAQPPAKPAEAPIYEEQVVVTASKLEQQLVNAPATMTVVTTDVIASTPATNYAELFRSVPGVNLSQTSARDFNLTMRSATSTLATSTLALLDGRSLYLDFFGFVAWDLLPVNPSELKQIEVIRGPASAVWGANAMNGVVNFISKTPRELDGNSATITFGAFNGDAENGEKLGSSSMFGINGTHARAVNDRWAYKVSAGGYTSDPFPRPTGAIPNGTGTQYPAFANQGTTQPKFDTRVDYDAPDGAYKLAMAGGYSGTDGIIHTGIGPFDMTGVGVTYGTVRYSRNAFKFNFFTNMLNGDASGLLAIGLDGKPILFNFDTKTYDVELGNINTFGGRHVLSYGGNVRYNQFDLSIAPRGDNRTEMGAYVQDEMFLNNLVRVSLGARFDKYDNIDDPVFSPRVALILKPAADHAVRLSFNKAFRSPSLINNYLETAIVNQLNLGAINPALSGVIYNFPVRANGNESLVEESTESFEVAYTGVIKSRATVSAAVYFTTNRDEIFFTQVGRYRATAPPPGWPLPPVVLEVLPPACAAGQSCTTGGLPSEFSYRNLGTVKNKGFELGIDGAVNRALNLFANYSYQATPDPDFALSEVNLPPKNRVNAGLSYNEGRFLGNLSVAYVDDAYWQDVLDARFAGPTEAYTQFNGAFGMRFAQDKITATIKGINLTNQEVQSHVFGDIIKRQIIGELRFQF